MNVIHSLNLLFYLWLTEFSSTLWCKKRRPIVLFIYYFAKCWPIFTFFHFWIQWEMTWQLHSVDAWSAHSAAQESSLRLLAISVQRRVRNVQQKINDIEFAEVWPYSASQMHPTVCCHTKFKHHNFQHTQTALNHHSSTNKTKQHPQLTTYPAPHFTHTTKTVFTFHTTSQQYTDSNNSHYEQKLLHHHFIVHYRQDDINILSQLRVPKIAKQPTLASFYSDSLLKFVVEDQLHSSSYWLLEHDCEQNITIFDGYTYTNFWTAYWRLLSVPCQQTCRYTWHS